MKLTILGTGNAKVTECYNTCFALSEGNSHFLVDGGGGNGILRQLKRAGINWMDIKTIFVTHKHIDHVMGIIWMIRMIGQGMKEDKYEGEVDMDEPYKECEREYAEHSKWLLHEAFCLHSQADIFHPYEKSHSTVKDACEIASVLGVENLVLYHTEDKNIRNRRELYMAEGTEYFKGNLIVPEDLEEMIL